MSTMRLRVPARSAAIAAVITRADGTVEDLGTISYWHKNPLVRWGWRLSRALRGKGVIHWPRS